MLGKPKYTYKQIVRFKCNNKELVGRIEIVDSYGTWEQNEEPSYDIYVESSNPKVQLSLICLYKVLLAST